MKLLRFGERGSEKPGLLDAGGTIRDLSGRIDDIGPKALAPEALARLAGLDPASLPAVDPGVRLGPCVANVGKLLCIGLNYSDHAAETGSPIPSEPILFMKATTAINGPDDPVIAPRGSTKLDWEVELGNRRRTAGELRRGRRSARLRGRVLRGERRFGARVPD